MNTTCRARNDICCACLLLQRRQRLPPPLRLRAGRLGGRARAPEAHAPSAMAAVVPAPSLYILGTVVAVRAQDPALQRWHCSLLIALQQFDSICAVGYCSRQQSTVQSVLIRRRSQKNSNLYARLPLAALRIGGWPPGCGGRLLGCAASLGCCIRAACSKRCSHFSNA